jgi:hypothetical protein
MRRTTTLLLCGLLSLPVTTAWAADSCLKTNNPCDPDKLCTFRAELAAKKLTYDTYVANQSKTGALYQAAMSQAKADLPNGEPAEIAAQAGANLQELVGKQVKDTFQPPVCETGMLDRSLVPKAGYDGMHTDPQCHVWADFESGLYEAESFGSNDRTSCPEFYDRDRAHEAIHKNLCEKSKKDRFGINALVQEELTAYRHTIELSRAYVRLLSLQCSAKRTPEKLKKRAREIQEQLAPYLSKAK